MTVFDRWLQRIPGSIQFKAFATGVVLCGALGYPIFAAGSGEGQKQGHDYFSQERPEAVIRGEEQLRKQYLQERDERRAAAAAATKQEQTQ